MNAPRWLRDVRFRIFYSVVTRKRADLITLGTACPWTICADGLNAESNVLCAGAGHDISFEKALIGSYGCKVILLDPSPTGIATVRQENLATKDFEFLPIGLAGVDGLVDFQKPYNASEGSFVGGAKPDSVALRLFCETPSTVMLRLGWSNIDLLKIDIEGFEYDVVQHILEKRLNVRQICVEFHHGGLFRHKRRETITAVLALRRAGYDLIHRSSWDHTFIRRNT